MSDQEVLVVGDISEEEPRESKLGRQNYMCVGLGDGADLQVATLPAISEHVSMYCYCMYHVIGERSKLTLSSCESRFVGCICAGILKFERDLP